MHENRSNMIQTEAQYVFIHQCVIQALINELAYQNKNLGEEQENAYVNQGHEDTEVEEGMVYSDMVFPWKVRLALPVRKTFKSLRWIFIVDKKSTEKGHLQ